MGENQKKVDNAIISQLEEYNRIFEKEKQKNKVRKLAQKICMIFHVLAYIPVVFNFYFLVEDATLKPSVLKTPVFRWLIQNFPMLSTDFKQWAIWSAILLWAIPLLVFFAVYIVLNIINNKKEVPELEPEPEKAAERLYSLGGKIKIAVCESGGLTKISTICGLIVGIATVSLLYVYAKEVFAEEGSIIGGIIFAAMMAGAGALLSLPIKWFTIPKKLVNKKKKFIENKTKELYKLWISFDPKEAKRNEEALQRARIQSIAEEKKRIAEEKKRSTKIVIHYDDSIDVYGNLTLTVYIDGTPHTLNPGRNEFNVSPGNHTLNCLIYNDGSESCSEVGAFSCYVASGTTYELDIPG